MEGYVFEWINFIKGWKARYLIIEKNFLFISQLKNDSKKKNIELTEDCKIIDDKKNKFSIDFGKKKIYFKSKTDEEKTLWIEKLKQNISEIKNIEIPLNAQINSYRNIKETPVEAKNIDAQINNDLEKPKKVEEKTTENLRFSNCYTKYQELIENEFQNSKMSNFDKTMFGFKNLQNLIFEYSNNLENFKEYIINVNNPKDNELKIIFNSFFIIKTEIKVNI